MSCKETKHNNTPVIVIIMTIIMMIIFSNAQSQIKRPRSLLYARDVRLSIVWPWTYSDRLLCRINGTCYTTRGTRHYSDSCRGVSAVLTPGTVRPPVASATAWDQVVSVVTAFGG